MADLSNVYDNAGGEGIREIKPLLGWQRSMIIKTEKGRENEKGNSQLQIRFRVMEGEFKDREASTFLSIWNSSDMAKEIANRELNSICMAVGILRPNLRDSAQLEGMALDVRFGPQKDKPEYSEPKEYRSLNAITGGGPSRAAGNAADGPLKGAWARTAS